MHLYKYYKIRHYNNKLLNLPILNIKFDCKNNIFKSLHQFCKFSILVISSWCKDISSKVPISPSLCSERFLISSIETVKKSYNIIKKKNKLNYLNFKNFILF